MMMRHTIAFLFVFLYLSFGVYAQQTLVKVVDAADGKPISTAHVCIESLDKKDQAFHITNNQGSVEFQMAKKSMVAISFLGYKSLIDTIVPNSSYTFKLIPTTEQLSEVVVTGQIKPETKDKSVYNIQLINSLDIQNKAANNLGELLSGETNINLRNSGILGTTIEMQGLSGEHIKILIDGVPVLGRQNGSIDLGQLNLQNVDHIEIVEGPMSVVYGSNALAGAINIITKSNVRPKYQINANGYYESVGVYNFDGNFTANKNRHHIYIGALRNFFNGYSFTDGDIYHLDFKPKEQYSGEAEYGYNADRFQVTAKQDLFVENLANYGSIYESGSIYIDSGYFSFPMVDHEFYKTTRANTKADGRFKINETSSLDVMAAYSLYVRQKNTYNKNLYYLTEQINNEPSKNDTTTFNSVVSRGTYTHFIKNFDYQAGYDLNIETGSGKRMAQTERIDDYAGFLSLQYKAFSKLSLQGGLRFIYNTKYNAPLVYSLNTKWSPAPNLNVRASYGTGFRSPSLKELYLSFIDVNHEVTGNPDLEAEYSKNINLSADVSTQNERVSHTFSLKLFHNLIDNKIDFLYDTANASKAEYINIEGTFKTIGTQCDVSMRLHPRFEFNLGVNYTGKSKYSDLDQYTYTPGVTTSINYHNLKYLFRLNIFYKYNGKQSQFFDVEKDGQPAVEERYTAAYNMMDITLNRPLFEDKLTLSTGVKNVFDVKTIESTGSSGSAHSGNSDGSNSIAWGRTFFVKLSFNLSKF